MPSPLIEVSNLSVVFDGRGGSVRAVDSLSFHIDPGEILAIVGESGCGKSATALSLLRLIAPPVGRVETGRVLFSDRDLMSLTEKQMRAIRGREIGMIFQEPMTSLNPVLTIGRQLTETLRVHRTGQSSEDPSERARDVLALVGLPNPAGQLDKYPHEMSGGMRQRVMIAMAVINQPKLLIADEPTTALDVTIQAQVLDLMARVRDETGTAILLITHDLGVVAEIAQRVVVMYAGRKVEEGSTEELLDFPAHPYTKGLIDAGPRLGSSIGQETRTKLQEIPGTVPIMRGDVRGCPFAPRCHRSLDRCRKEFPAQTRLSPSHVVSCFNPEGIAT